MYSQKIEVTLCGREKTILRVVNFDDVPKYCYCRTDSEGNANLTVYTISEDGKYMIAEGASDRTVFMLLKIVGKEDDKYVTEYVGDATNPMDEMYSHLCGVHWYDEYGFCKLEFFNLDYMPSNKDMFRRIYYNKKLD